MLAHVGFRALAFKGKTLTEIKDATLSLLWPPDSSARCVAMSAGLHGIFCLADACL
jgi:hypothetical protein